MQQSLKEFLEGINCPSADDFDYDTLHEYGFQEGQYELAQEILGKYFTENNYEE